MAGISTHLREIEVDIEIFKSWVRARMDAMEKEIVEFGERLDKYDKPASDSPGTKTREKRRPVPVPERPDVMDAAGVGKDP